MSKETPRKNTRSKTSRRWMQEHVQDPFVHQAQKDGYRARAAYKLLEINDKDQLFQNNSVVVDLGSAPGSWSQVAAKKTAGKATLIALDILPMAPIEGVTFIQGDFREEEVLHALLVALNDQAVDLVISDMAPNMSGQAVTDQARSFYLAELALDFAVNHLRLGGDFLVKVFQGSGFEEYRRQMAQHFQTVYIRKPRASRDRSSEVYLLGKHFLIDK